MLVVTEGVDTVDTALLAQWCAEELAYYKVPVHWEVRTERLPRNASGKIVKRALEDPDASGFIEE